MGFTTSRKTAAAALAAAVLLGGGIAAVAPAAAEDSAQFAATNWKKVWKNDLQQYADKRYYTKKKSDKKYATKADSGQLLHQGPVGRDLRDQGADVQQDGLGREVLHQGPGGRKYAPFPSLIRGAFELTGNTAAAGQGVSGDISFGVTLSAAPSVRVMPPGGPVPAGCSGSLACAERLGRITSASSSAPTSTWLPPTSGSARSRTRCDSAPRDWPARSEHGSSRSPQRPAMSSPVVRGRCGLRP